MGSNAVQTGRVKISFKFDNNPEQSLVINMHPCDMEVKDTLDGYPVKSCGCNYCEPACRPVDTHAFPAFFDGFNIIVVSIVYACLIVISVIIYFVKRKWQSGEDDDEISNDADDNENMNGKLLDSYDIKDEDSRRKNISNGKSIRKEDSTDSYGPINKSSLVVSMDIKDSQHN